MSEKIKISNGTDEKISLEIPKGTFTEVEARVISSNPPEVHITECDSDGDN